MFEYAANKALFASLAQDLKVPLLKIAYMAEMGGDTSDAVGKISQEALQLLDAYLLGIQLQSGQDHLLLEPVHPSAILSDTLYDVSHYAKKFSCQLRVSAPAHLRTALVHRPGLRTALSAVAKVFIEAQDVLGSTERVVEVAAYNSSKGITVGVFHAFDQKTFSTQLLAQARSTCGQAARPYAGLSSGASSYLFAAEQILHAMQSDLRSAKRGTMTGLATDLRRSDQLCLLS